MITQRTALVGTDCHRALLIFPIGGHVNVLSDYKETGHEKIIKY